MSPFRVIALTLCCLAAAACAPPTGAPADADGAADSGSAAAGRASTYLGRIIEGDANPAPTGDFRVVSVLLGNEVDADQVVLGDRALFSRRDRIHASVLSTGASPGLRLSARWLGPDGQAIAETTQPLVASRAAATTFSVRNRQPWPVGNYQVVIAIDGRPEQTRRFQIR